MGEKDFSNGFDDDEFDDEYGDVDEAALIEAAAQVESQLQYSSSNPLQFFGGNSGQDWLQPRRVSNGPLRQTTLTGAPLRENVRPTQTQRQSSGCSGPASQPQMAPNKYRLMETQNQEPPTHHRLDLEAAKTWIYPSNMAHRDYQFNIVQGALFNNLLVALPTGLGKTFIAAVVMLNWYRWAPEGHLLFLAPTKPLVEQQIDACYNITGIPRRQTVELTGRVTRKIRAEYWEERRVFFGTPQTIENDLKYGLADPKKIVCVVIDEAHRATGNYAYTKVVKFIRKFNPSFRLLALTATPGTTVESVQEVIDSLGIARVEIRTEDSLDIRQFIHRKNVEEVVIELSSEINELRELFAGCMQPFLDELRSKKATFLMDAEKIQLFTLVNGQKEWLRTPAAQNLPEPAKWAIRNMYQLLISLAHPFTLLQYHGIRSFYTNITAVRNELESGRGKLKERLFGNSKWKQLMQRTQEIMASPTSSDHPKLDHLLGSVLTHFMDCEERGETNTKIIIFSSFRGSGEEIVRILKQHEPKIRPHIFVGQQDSKNGQAGMSQPKQQEVIRKLKEGVYNTLVATSIGEEGLDIGEVDLIVCYDSSASPIRMLQRMGRTGRKRAGKIILLLTKGKEEDAFRKAKDNYDRMQKMIISGEHFTFRHEVSPRILPRGVVPVVDKQHIIPLVEVPEPQKLRGRRKLPPKRFHMPDGVNSGFIKASRIGKLVAPPSEEEEDDDVIPVESDTESLAPNYPDASSTVGLLNEEEEKHLHKYYTQAYGDEEVITVTLPRLDVYPEFQRSLNMTKFVGHSKTTRSVVKMLNVMQKYEEDPASIEKLKANFREEDLLAGRDSLSPPLVEKPQPKAMIQETGWKFGSLAKHKFVPPKSNATTPIRRKRAKKPPPISLSEDEVKSAVELLHDPSPFTSSALYNEEDIIMVDREELEIERDVDGDVKEDEDGGDDDDELPDASVLIERSSTPQRTKAVKVRNGAARKKRRIADSDEDKEG